MENKESKGVFKTLYELNVNDKTEKKSNLSYLSWTFAWSEVKKLYPDASYQIWKDEDGNPFTHSKTLGYMCYTTVRIEDETLEMWLPVMNGANKAMRDEAYVYTTKYGEKSVEAATMFDINKTIMRCLVKNLAMFGLGLYIYAGEDLPEQEPEPKKLPPFTKNLKMWKQAIEKGHSLEKMKEHYSFTDLNEKAYMVDLGINKK